MRAGPQSIPYQPFSKQHPVVRILSQSSFRGFEQEKKKKMVQIQFPEPEKPMEERGADVERAGQGRAPLQIHKYTNTQIHKYKYTDLERGTGVQGEVPLLPTSAHRVHQRKTTNKR